MEFSYAANIVGGTCAGRVVQKTKQDCGRKNCPDPAAYEEAAPKVPVGGNDKDAK